jgi:hypothetical protein
MELLHGFYEKGRDRKGVAGKRPARKLVLTSASNLHINITC